MQPVSNKLDNIANTISFFISISPLIINLLAIKKIIRFINHLLGNNKIILSPSHPVISPTDSPTNQKCGQILQ